MRAPLSYLILAAVFTGIMLWWLLLATGQVDVETLLVNFIPFITNLILLTFMAVLAAILVGMLLSRHILLKGSATPFESSMLYMKEDLDRLDRRLCEMGRRECEDWPADRNIPSPGKTPPKVPRLYWLIMAFFVGLTFWMFFILTRVVSIDWNYEQQFIGFTSIVVVIVIGAVLGAFFFGMFLSHRIITRGSFTPFETSMMQMKERLARMNDHLDHMEKNTGDGKGGDGKGRKRMGEGTGKDTGKNTGKNTGKDRGVDHRDGQGEVDGDRDRPLGRQG